MSVFMYSQAIVAANPFSMIWDALMQALGWIMNLIYMFEENILQTNSVALCIILFTVILYTLLVPLQIKQQKTMKLNAVVQPEINAISKKYKNKKDQESAMKQNEEMQAVYKKYGTSPTSGCLTSFIQLPILLALYRVLYNVPKYVEGVRNLYSSLTTALMETDYEEIMAEFASSKAVNNFNLEGLTDSEIATKLTQVIYKFTSSDWTSFAEKFPDLDDVIAKTQSTVEGVNRFLGMNIAESPSTTISNAISAKNWGIVVLAVMIPLLAGVLSWLSTKVSSSSNNTQPDPDNAMASSLKTMNVVMPIFSIWICYTLSIGIGIYWVTSSLYRVISTLIINKRMEKVDVDKLIEQNLAKYNKKQEKRGLPQQQRTNMKEIAKANVRDTELDEKRKEEREKKLQDSNDYYSKQSSEAKPGSMKSKANMVAQYNEKNMKKKK